MIEEEVDEESFMRDGFQFRMTCISCPEQYDIYADGIKVGYVRVRFGRTSLSYPDACQEILYQYQWPNDPYKGKFDTDEEKWYHIDKMIVALKVRLGL